MDSFEFSKIAGAVLCALLVIVGFRTGLEIARNAQEEGPVGYSLPMPETAQSDLPADGAAAVEAMKALDVYDALSPKVVRGNNIAQVYQFIETGNAEIGFVALSQIARQQTGSRWIVPTDLYAPITQDAVLLECGSDNAAARTFLTFLNSADANAVKKEFGYGTADEQGH